MQTLSGSTSIQSVSPAFYIWDDRLLYIGSLPPNTWHRNSVDVLCVNLDRPLLFSVDESENWEQCKSVFWPANSPHQSIYNQNLMAFLFIEQTSSDSLILKKRMRSNTISHHTNLKDEKTTIEILRDIYLDRPSYDQANKLLDKAINPNGNYPPENRIDNRIRKIKSIIRDDPTKLHSIDELADEIYLSPGRLEHLFKEQIRVPISRYRMWCRLINAVSNYDNNHLTEVAQNSGFTDLSHFNRTFKSIVGFNPSSFLAKKNIDIITS